MRRHSVVALTLALCMTVVASATAAQGPNPPLPSITSVQLDMPSAGKITIDGTGFGAARPTVAMGGRPLVVNDRFHTARILANLPVALPAAGPQEPAGAQGPHGEQEPQGIQGPAGANVVSPAGAPEPAGGNCQYGGLKYTDLQGVHYVCNGAPGPGSTAAVEARLLALERSVLPIACVSKWRDDTVSVVNTVAQSVVTVRLDYGPGQLAIDPGGTRVYVTHGYQRPVSVIDTATLMVAATIPVGSTTRSAWLFARPRSGGTRLFD